MTRPPDDELRVRDLVSGTPPAAPPTAPPPAPRPPAVPQVPQVVVETRGEEGQTRTELPFDVGVLLVGLWRRRLLVLLIAGLFTAIAVIVALAIRSHDWSVWVTILRKREQKEFLVTSNTPIVKLQIYTMPTVLRLVKVNENLKAAIDALKLDVETTELSKHITVDNPKDTDILEIVVTWPDGPQAVQIANTVARAFVRNIDRLQKLEAIQAYDYLGAQLAQTRVRLARVDAELVRFKSDHALVKLSDQTGQLVAQLGEFDALAQKERLDAEMAAQAVRVSRDELARQDSTIVASVYVKQPLKVKLVELQTQLADALAVYTDESSKVKELRDEITRVEGLVRQGLEEQLYEKTVSRNPVLSSVEQTLIDKTVEAATREARANGYAIARDRYRARLLELPALENQLATMQQTADTLRRLETTLAERVEEVRVIRDSPAANFSIMQEARLPEYPLPSKSKLVVILGLLLGFMAGLSAALGLELTDRTIKAGREVERATGLALLAEVPLLPADEVLAVSRARGAEPVVETFRQLLSALLQRRKDQRSWLLVVTSAVHFEGRTSVCLNLARVATARGLRVCVVDASLRKPNLTPLAPQLGLPSRGAGLAEILRGEATADEVIAQSSEPESPAFVACGSSATVAPEMLGGGEMRSFAAALRQRFDLVLFDAMPILARVDSLLLAPLTDGAIYVLEASAQPRAAHREAIARLAATTVPIVGAVLNKVQPEYSHRFSPHALVEPLTADGSEHA